jgi:flavin reductase (DIM6/NTAB) family NADH-FMN oxidoreductase RutF
VNDFDDNEEPRTFSPAELRRTLAHFPTGVTVVTVLDEAGHLHGLTASSFTSVSLDPPLVLVCVGYGSRSYPIVVDRKQLAVHVLAEEQIDTARAFAEPGLKRHAACQWRRNDRGFGILESYLALFECRLIAEHRGGDHAILVCHVDGIDVRDTRAAPLLFHRGRLGSIGSGGKSHCPEQPVQ